MCRLFWRQRGDCCRGGRRGQGGVVGVARCLGFVSAARMMIFIAGAARQAGRGICSAKFPFTPKAALQAWPTASRRDPSAGLKGPRVRRIRGLFLGCRTYPQEKAVKPSYPQAMIRFAKPPFFFKKKPPRIATKCPLGARRRKRGLQGFKRLLCLSDLTLANREFSRALQAPFSSGFRVLGDEGGWKGAAARPLPVRRAESGTKNIIRAADSN